MYIIEELSVLAEMIFTYILFNCVANAKAVGNKKRLWSLTVVFLMITYGYLLLQDFVGAPQPWSMGSYLIYITFFMVVYRMHIGQAFLHFIVCACLCIIMQFLMMIPFILVHRVAIYESVQNLIINSVLIGVTLLLYRYARLERMISFIRRKNTLYAIAIIAIASGLVYAMVFVKVAGALNVKDYVIIIGFVVILSLVLTAWQRSIIEARRSKQELEMRDLYENTFEELVNKIRGRQHEFDNHITAILSQQYAYRDYESLVAAQNDYCESLQEENQYYPLLLLGNATIGGFLYSKLSKMEEQGVSVTYQTEWMEDMTTVPTFRMIEMMGILLDNAVEASSNRPNPQVDLKLMVDNQVQITVANEHNYIPAERVAELTTKGFTTKSMDGSRGFGLYHLKQIMSGCKGNIIMKNEDRDGGNWFVIQLEFDTRAFTKER